MNQKPSDAIFGFAAGIGAGLVASFAMNEFQALLARGGITSGVSGRPSTEKAGDRVSKTFRGRRLRRSERAVTAEAMHYAVGGITAGLYGVAAELEPRVTLANGAAFGIAAASVVDETLVPALGLGEPLWRAPPRSHPYSYASHLVYGMTTELMRRALRRLFRDAKAGWDAAKRPESRPPLEMDGPRGWRALALAFLIGATAGPRTSAPFLATSWAARLGWIDLRGSRLAFMAWPAAAHLAVPMALAEFTLDKLPGTPDRTKPAGVIGRVASGALSGAALTGGRSRSAALAGATGALLATYVGHAIRKKLSLSLGKDWPVAGAEDALAFGGALLVCFASLAPGNANEKKRSTRSSATTRTMPSRKM